MRSFNPVFIALLWTFFLPSRGLAADLSASMKVGKPDLLSAGPLAFAPDGILLVGDPEGGAVFAIETGDRDRLSYPGPIAVERIDIKAAALLGVRSARLQIQGMAVNPASGKAYLSVSHGQGANGVPAILRVDQQGKIEVVDLENVRFAKALLDGSSGARRRSPEKITELTFVNGRVFVAGMSSEAGVPTLRAASFPFKEGSAEKNAEKPQEMGGPMEALSHVRTLAPDAIEKEPYLLARITLSPRAKLPSGEERAGERANEFGARDPKDPLDRVMIQTVEAWPYQAIDSMKGVQRMDRLDDEHALVLVRAESGTLNLQTVTLP